MLCAFLGVLLRRFSQVGMRRAGNGVGECYNCISRVSLMILSCHIWASSYAVFHIAVQKKIRGCTVRNDDAAPYENVCSKTLLLCYRYNNDRRYKHSQTDKQYGNGFHACAFPFFQDYAPYV